MCCISHAYCILFYVSVDMGTCIIFFYTLCTLRNVHRGNLLLDFLHTYFVKHVFVDGSCHDKSVTERDAFSDEEDSDEEDSEYEEVVIPKKQQQPKRKRGANTTVSSKRIKPNPKPQIRIPKKNVPRATPNKQVPKKRSRASIDVPGPPPGAPLKRFKPKQSKPSSIPSRR